MYSITIFPHDKKTSSLIFDNVEQSSSPINTAYFAGQLLCTGALLNNSTALRGSIDFDDVSWLTLQSWGLGLPPV